MTFILLFLLAIGTLFSSGGTIGSFTGSNPPSVKTINYRIPLQKLSDSLKVYRWNTRILVDKSEYQLKVMKDTVVIKSYPVVLGPNPVADKLRKGDGCTPEGCFRIKTFYPHRKWSRFIWFDYPNEESYRKHNLAKEKGLIPQRCDIGGELGIHGVPPGQDYLIDQGQNWTLGCVSMKNRDVAELYDFVFEGMVVEIVK